MFYDLKTLLRQLAAADPAAAEPAPAAAPTDEPAPADAPVEKGGDDA